MPKQIEISLTQHEARYLFNLLEGIELSHLPYLNRKEYGDRNKQVLEKLKHAYQNRYVKKITQFPTEAIRQNIEATEAQNVAEKRLDQKS